MIEPWLVFLIVTSLSLALCLLFVPVARRTKLIDRPAERKIHRASVPLAGGPAILTALIPGVFFLTPYAEQSLPLLIVCGLMMITGLLDDLYELSPLSRFILQIMACCIMILVSGVVLTDFGSLLWNGVFSLGWLSIPITVFSALGVINAFNMVDGIDGLAAMIFIVACAAMAWLALRAGFDTNFAVLMVAVAAVFGFFLLNARFPWNRSARLFLGDSGSMFLGLFLAWQFIDLGNGETRAFAPMTAVWLLGVPLVDTIRLMSQRWHRGGSSLRADQYHLHHAFLKAGFTVNQTVAAMTLLVLFTTVVGLAGEVFGWPEFLMFYAYIIFGLVYLHIMRRCWIHGRFLGRDVARELN